ncbi:hypothetical protein Tco_0664851 [Tanacetum coccineum]
MTSFNRRLNSLYAIKECSSCGALYTADCGCLEGSLEDKILVPIPESSQRPLKIERICLDCGNLVHGLYCRRCALTRKTLEELFLQITFESSDDNTNVVNAPQEPFVVKQDPGENSSQSPPHIDHNCCYECGDSLDGIFCQRCTCKSCGKGAHYGYNYPLKVLIISNPEPCNNQTIDELPQTLPSFDPTCYSEKGNSLPYDEEKRIEEEQATKARYWKIPVCYDDDDDEESSIPLKDIIIYGLPPCVAITPDSPKMDSLIMVDKHLDTIPETESDEFIKSNVENLVQNPSESEDECECDVPDCDDSQTTNFSMYSNPLFDDSTSSDDERDKFNLIHNEDPDSTPKNDRFNTKSYLLESLLNQIKDSNPEGDIRLMERLLYDNSTPRPSEAFQVNSDTIIESFPTFTIPVEDSDSLFPGLDDSIPIGVLRVDDFDSGRMTKISTPFPSLISFHVDYPDLEIQIDVVEDLGWMCLIFCPPITPFTADLRTFIPSNDLGSDLDDSSPFGDRNKIYDPGICIEVESTRILATLSLVIDTLLLFSPKCMDKVLITCSLLQKRNLFFFITSGLNVLRFPGCFKPLVLAVLSHDHKSFASSASIWESDIQILSTNVYLCAYLINGLRIYVETLLKTLRTMFNSSMGGSIDLIVSAVVVFM